MAGKSYRDLAFEDDFKKQTGMEYSKASFRDLAALDDKEREQKTYNETLQRLSSHYEGDYNSYTGLLSGKKEYTKDDNQWAGFLQSNSAKAQQRVQNTLNTYKDSGYDNEWLKRASASYGEMGAGLQSAQDYYKFINDNKGIYGNASYDDYLKIKPNIDEAQKAKDEYEKWLEQYIPQTQYTPGNQDRKPVTELKVDDIPDSQRIGPASRIPGYVGQMAGNNMNMTDQGNRIPPYIDPRNIARGPKIPTAGSAAVSDEDRLRDMYNMGGPDEAARAAKPAPVIAPAPGTAPVAARPTPAPQDLYATKPAARTITGGRGMNRIADLPALAQQEYEQNTAKGANSVVQGIQAERDALQTKRNELFTEITGLDEQIRYNAPSPQQPEAYREFIAMQERKRQAEQELSDIDEQLKPVDQRMTEATDQLDILKLQEQYAGMEGYAPAQQEYQQKLGALEYKADWNKMAPVEQFGVWLGDRSKRAALNLNEAIYAVPDMIAGWAGADKLDWSKNNEKALAEVQRNIAVQSSQMNWAADAIGDVITTGIEMVPTILMAIASGGTSLAAQGASTIATAGGTFGARLAQTALSLFKSPVFLNTYFREFGQNLSELRASGVPDLKAIIMSTQMAFPNSLIEGIGGPEAAAKAGPGIINWFVNSAGEGIEEPVQGIVSKVITAANSGDAMLDMTIDDIISLTNSDAIISVPRAVEEAAMGVAAGLFMGGMQAGASSLMDSAGRGMQRARSMSVIQDYTLKLNEFSARFPADHPVAMWSQYVKPDVPGAASAILASLEMDAMNAVPGSPEQMQAQQDADTFLDITRNLYNASAQFAAAQPKGKMEQETPVEPQKPIQEALDYQAEYNANVQRAEQPAPAQAQAENLEAAEADDEIIDDTAPYEEAPAEPLIPEITEQAAPEPVIPEIITQPEQPAVSNDTIPAQEQPAPVEEQRPVQEQPRSDAQFTAIAADYAKAGLRISDLAKVIGPENITPETNQAFERGKADAKSAAERRAQEIIGKGPVQGRRGFVRSISTEDAARYKVEQIGRMTPTLRAATAGLRNLADASGLNFVVYESPMNRQGEHIGRRGFYDRKTGTVYLDVKAGKGNEEAILSAAGHEITHFIEQYAPEFYHNQYRQAVIDEFYNGDEDAYAELVKEQIDIAKSNGKQISEVKAAREVIAEASSKMLFGSKETLQRLVGENPRLFTRIKNWIDNFVKSLQRAFTLTQSDPEASKILQGSMERFKAIQSNWWHAFEEAAVNLRGEDGPTTPSAYEQARQARQQYQPKPAQAQAQTVEEMPDFGAMFAGAVDAQAVQNMTDEEVQTLLSLPEAEQLAQGGKDAMKGVARTPLSNLMENKSYSKKFKNLVKKWAGNEWVNIDLNILSESANSFIKFAKKWYNIGRENQKPAGLTVPILRNPDGTPHQEPNTYQYDDNDLGFPPFLQDEFKSAGAEFEAAKKTAKPTKKGAKPNVREDADSDTAGNRGDVEQLPDRGQADGAANDASGRVRADAGTILAGESAENVQRAGGQAETATDAAESRGPVSQPDGGDDAQRTGRGSGEGDNSGGSVQPDAGELKTETSTDKSALESIEEQIERIENGVPKQNYIIPAEGLNLPTGKKERFRVNADAIRIAKELEATGRLATEEEKAAMSRYVGWGGIPEAFDERAKVQEQWGNEYGELRALLTEEEYKQARASTTNAHYTDIGVIRGMYTALKAMGFDGGTILEPSSGVGNFIGAMPAMDRPSSWLAVELDPITALIAKHVYPASNVVNDGFQSVNIPNNYFDVAIGNVPFGKTGVTDKTYPKYLTSPLHNYFFVKAIDKVHEGGILMFITSSFTMDGAGETFRKYMATKADLLGAVRLPTGAFSANAGTEVVTDILVFKKRAAGTEYAGQDFISQGVLSKQTLTGGYGGRYEHEYEGNVYFANNPDMILGDMYVGRGQYQNNELMYKARTDTPLGDQIVKALSKIDYKYDYDARNKAIRDELKAAFNPKESNKPDGAVVVEGGSVYRVKNGKKHLDVEATASPKVMNVIRGLFELRDIRRDLISAQLKGSTKAVLDAIRGKLNTAYDAFVDENGFINNPNNLKHIKEDPDVYGIMSLEDYVPANKRKGKPAEAKKSAIFNQDTVAKRAKTEKAESLSDAVSISMNETGSVNIERISELLGITPGVAEKQIIKDGLAYKGSNGKYIPAEVYLSGKVRQKLREAQALANVDASYRTNVEALEKVIPPDVKYEDIHINLGASWIPLDVYKAFVMEVLEVREWDSDGVSVQRMRATNSYKIELSSKVKSQARSINEIKYRAGRNTFASIVEKIMNDSSFQVREKVTDAFGNEKTVINKEATALNNERAEQIKTLFKTWLANNAEISASMLRLYNDTFNDLVEPAINGDKLTIEGASPLYKLRKHQKDVIQRAMNLGGNMLIAHAVGAGKTAELAGIAMKMRQLGTLKKPMFVVPKKVATGWGTEFLKFFPSAKVLVPSDADYESANRKTLVNRIATGDYDAVIVSQEIFESIPMSDEATSEFYQQQINEMLDAMHEFQLEQAAENEAAGYSRRGSKAKTDFTVKQIENAIKRLQKKLDDISNKNKQDADNITFESLGIDGLFVDEAQDYKNLYIFTKLGNVQGLGTKDAGLTLDMLQKIRYMQKLNGGNGIFFATATPVMNSLSELYAMMKYLVPNVLKEKNIESFDAWAKVFAEVTNELQLSVTGDKYEVKRVLSRYKNLPELQALLRSWADILVEVEGLKELIPGIKGGKAVINEVEASPLQRQYMAELVARAKAMKGHKPEKGGDNMLKISDDGRMISYAAMMRYPGVELEPSGKIAKLTDNITRIWKETSNVKGTQLVFMDRGVNEQGEVPSLYKVLKQQLMLRGIPAKEIGFVNDASNEVKRAELFEDVRAGDVRILIGTSAKMGVGVNIQDRVAAIHHSDVPWRPGDLIQRDGRAFRQGNMFKDLGGVELHYYVTKETFDAYMWQKIKVKSTFIQQVMSGKNASRESEGEGMALTAAEVTAIASGNPIVLEQFTVMGKMERINALRRQYDIDKKHNMFSLEEAKKHKTFGESRVKLLTADLKKAIPTKGNDFNMTVQGKTYTNRAAAGQALMDAYKKTSHDTLHPIGQFAGFDMSADKAGYIRLLSQSGLTFIINPESAAGTIQSAEHEVNSIQDNIDSWIKDADKTDQDIAAFEAAIAEPFTKEAEYAALKARSDEIMAILGPSESENADNLDDTDTDAATDDNSDDNVDNALRRLTAEDFMQLNPEDPARLEDRKILADRLDDILNADRDPRQQSARQMLANAFDTIAINDYDKSIIARYKARMTTIETDATALDEINRKIKELSFAPGERNMTELAKLKNNKETLRNKIARQDAGLLKLENAKPIASLLTIEKQKAAIALKTQRKDMLAQYRQETKEKVTAAKEKGAEKLTKYKDTQSAAHYRERIKEIAAEITEWITNPTGKKYVPEVLRTTIGDFLLSINEASQRSLRGGDSTIADRDFRERLTTLRDTISRLRNKQQSESGEFVNDVYESLNGYFDLPDNYLDELTKIVDSTKTVLESASGEHVLNRMDAAQLKELDKLMRTLASSIKKMNKTMMNKKYERVDSMGVSTITDKSAMKNKLTRTGAVDRFLNWDNIEPYYAFERMGEAGRSIFEEFMAGQDRMAKNSKEIVDFAEKTFTKEESRAWSKELHTFNLHGKELTLTTAHLMALYCLNKRKQARGHIYGGGIRVSDFKIGSQRHADGGHVITEDAVNKMLSKLTAKQLSVAKALQHFMATRGAELGNQVSLVRFDTELFGGEGVTYFPIESVRENMDENMDAPEGNPLYRLLNLSMTKGLTEGANNQLMVHNIFDVFAAHMSDMAQYNALALPILDAVKWYNFRQSYLASNGQKHVDSVKGAIRNAFGDPALSYLTQLLKDINGARVTTGGEGFLMNAVRHYNRSAVAANLRVALLQPTSIVRAHNVIDARYLTAGSIKNLARMKLNIREMEKYSGIAAWKQMGFYDVNLSRSLQDMIKRDDPLLERITGKTMLLPQTMDRITWAAMWEAAKLQTAARHPRLGKNTPAFFEKVQELFDKTIYATQVVDSMLTRSDYMRKNTFGPKWMSSFMSEPTKTYNILANQVHAYNDAVASGQNRAQAWSKHGKAITRTVATYAASVVLVTMVEALTMAWRDDDEFKTFWEKLMAAGKEALIDNLMPLNLPIINDIWELFKNKFGPVIGPAIGIDMWGFEDTSPLTQGLSLLSDGVTALIDRLGGKETRTTDYGIAYKLLQGASAITGHPMASATREVVDLWNHTVAVMYPQYVVKRYDASSTGGFDALWESIEAGDTDATTRLRAILDSKGEDDKTILSGLQTRAKEAYQGGKLTQQRAAEILGAQPGADKDDVYWLTRKWEDQKQRNDWSAENYGKYDLYMQAITTGSNLRKYMDELLQHGGTKSAIAGEITDVFKPLYIAARNRERAEIKARLLNAYTMLGYDRDDRSKAIDAWLKPAAKK